MRTRKLILGGGAPDERFDVPGVELFESQGEFVEAQGCEKIGEALIQTLDCFATLRDAKIVYLWKRKAANKPKLKMGRCNRPSGLLRHFSQADFVIWFAANNCRDVAMTRWQMEALIFHELKHARMEDGAAVTVPHDWEGFAEEIERYGFWKRDIKPIAEAVSNALTLPFDGPLEV